MIAIGNDHGGFSLKEVIISYFKDEGIAYKDFGSFSTEAVDYAEVALTIAEAVARGEFEKGILICGTGIGIGIAANKVPGIRAALCSDTFSARASRQHNDANILTFGERVIGAGVALDIVNTWLKTQFSGDERHERRIQKITDIEKKYMK